MMKFYEVAEILRKHGYREREIKEGYRVFYEFGVMDFLYSDTAKRFEVFYEDAGIEKIVMTQYWFKTTEFRDIETLEDLQKWA